MAFYTPYPNSSYLITKNAIQKYYSGLDLWLRNWVDSLHFLFLAFNWAVFWIHLHSRDAVWALPTSRCFPPQWFRPFRQRDNRLIAQKTPGAEFVPLQSICYRYVWKSCSIWIQTHIHYIPQQSLHTETYILQAMKEVIDDDLPFLSILFMHLFSTRFLMMNFFWYLFFCFFFVSWMDFRDFTITSNSIVSLRWRMIVLVISWTMFSVLCKYLG